MEQYFLTVFLRGNRERDPPITEVWKSPRGWLNASFGSDIKRKTSSPKSNDKTNGPLGLVVSYTAKWTAPFKKTTGQHHSEKPKPRRKGALAILQKPSLREYISITGGLDFSVLYGNTILTTL